MESDHRAPAWLKFVDHTGDAGIMVRAPNLEVLFERAAWGMFSIIADLSAVRALKTARLSVAEADRAALLVRWLSELNYRHVIEHVIFSEFRISALGEQHLEADVLGETFDATRHTIFTEIKAVTFHGLQLECEGGVWKAQIIFDL